MNKNDLNKLRPESMEKSAKALHNLLTAFYDKLKTLSRCVIANERRIHRIERHLFGDTDKEESDPL